MASGAGPDHRLLLGHRLRHRRAAARATAGRSTPPRAARRRSPTLEPPRAATTLALDVTDEASMSAAVDARRPRPRAPSACSSTTPATASPARSRASPLDDVRRQFETNVFGLIRMCQLVLPGMRERGWGKIVNIGSMGGRLDVPGRRHLPRHQVRGRGDLRRAALRGARLRGRRGPDRARADRHQVRRGRGRLGRRGAAGDGPYADFNRHVAKTTAGVYKGPMAKLGGGPEVVADDDRQGARRPSARRRATRSRPARTCSSASGGSRPTASGT